MPIFVNPPLNSVYNLFDQIKMSFGGIDESVKLCFSSVNLLLTGVKCLSKKR